MVSKDFQNYKTQPYECCIFLIVQVLGDRKVKKNPNYFLINNTLMKI
jgi:hypothetical protein